MPNTCACDCWEVQTRWWCFQKILRRCHCAVKRSAWTSHSNKTIHVNMLSSARKVHSIVPTVPVTTRVLSNLTSLWVSSPGMTTITVWRSNCAEGSRPEAAPASLLFTGAASDMTDRAATPTSLGHAYSNRPAEYRENPGHRLHSRLYSTLLYSTLRAVGGGLRDWVSEW